jgi:hypothetical protein
MFDRLANRMRPATMVLGLLLSACNSSEQASVEITYETGIQANSLYSSSMGRQNVETAFKLFSKRNGYKCQANFKRVEEIDCRGPKDIFLRFVPTLNKPEFVATFGWVESGDRTHSEFERLVSEFGAEMSRVVGSQNVRVSAPSAR